MLPLANPRSREYDGDMLYGLDTTLDSPARQRGTKRMAVMPALTQTEDGEYEELETGGAQGPEGGGAQTVQGGGGPKHGDTKEGGPTSESRGTRGRESDGLRGRIRRR